ncbi:TlpA family protein disulfide reductase [Halobiforma nitratireducens]|uniref:Thioredoxin domain-containing protein n=1 Tax=Halobiforma nitratireducens JCM 10879 TaxID=1227454 RepID=M0M1G5_9EURY|nr:TlpA disulfide reductase family protein [Halobiforma nitratireducens]EMA39662.1 hypothetical protein C446_08341 [Halobiforma nitratireducens JCM 10879]
MNRRELLATTGGAIAVTGCLEGGTDGNGSDTDTTDEGDGTRTATDAAGAVPPFEITTVDAPGSDAGTVTVPQERRVTLVNFTRTECPTSERLLETIGDARNRLEDDHEVGPNGTVAFLSVTDDTRGLSPSATELADWWEEHDGDWSVGIDEGGHLNDHYDVPGFPMLVVLDGEGDVRWRHRGSTSASTIAFAIRDVFDDESSGDGNA